MNEIEFVKECNKINIDIDEDIINKLNKYKELLKEWNEKFNLTTIIKDDDIYLKHFFDSIYICSVEDFNNKKVCDFGTGAGFPGMVIAILYKDAEVTLIESNSKKIEFLKEVKKQLNLKNVEIINNRAELFGKTNIELFDIVTCRAVSSLNIILELSVSLLKVNGLFIPMKSNIEEELNKSKKITKDLGYELLKIKKYVLPKEESNRSILIYKKISKTSLKYPRNYNIIKKENDNKFNIDKKRKIN